MPTPVSPDNQMSALTKRVSDLEYQMSFHKHIGTDQTTKIALPSVKQIAFGGRMTSNAAGTPFPTGWTASHPSTGNYQIVHNLGHQNYSVVVFLHAIGYAQLFTFGTNSFNVNTKNTTPADANTDFDFVLIDMS